MMMIIEIPDFMSNSLYDNSVGSAGYLYFFLSNNGIAGGFNLSTPLIFLC
jgi:hypothetical protein